jgi:acyl-CoA synthetase (AMP-forming)/AMP-acid ligase II
MMTILLETEVQREIQRLHRAWEDNPTFALVPEKSGVKNEWIEKGLALLPDELKNGHFVLLTSGTTGAPKLIVGQRQRSEKLATVLHQAQESEPVQETILALPLSYSYAFVNQWLWSHCHQRTLKLTPGLSDPAEMRRALQQARKAMICLVGVQVPLLAAYFKDETFPGVLRVHFAGGRFPQENLPLVRALFPEAAIFNNYGCAEALPRLTLRKAEEADQASDVGRPLPGIELSTNDANELLFRSPYGAVGIVEDDKFNAITFEAWVKSGDLAQPTELGTWRLLGRANEIFKRHGEKISLATLMTTVTGIWTGQAVFYREQDSSGENGHVLVLAPPPAPGQLQEILLSFRRHHGRAHWPLRIEGVAALPLLPNGKTDVSGAAAMNDKTLLWHQRI